MTLKIFLLNTCGLLSRLIFYSFRLIFTEIYPADQVLSELSTMTHLSWVALHGIAHSFIELDKAVIHVISLAGFM